MGIKIEALGDHEMEEAIERYKKRASIIQRAISDAQDGKISSAVSKERKERFLERQGFLKVDSPDALKINLEAAIGKTDDIVSIEFLEAGLLAAKPVGRVTVSGGLLFGSGFLVGEGLFLTNHHVLPTKKLAEQSVVEFNYEEHKFGTMLPSAEFFIEPDRFWMSSKEFDFTLVALSPFDISGVNVKSFGWHPLLGEGKILEGMPVNIIQHPDGGYKSIAVHNSYFLLAQNGTESEQFCWYTGDTRKGSSGGPVFNKAWEVVALHHKAVPRVNEQDEILDTNGDPISKTDFEKRPWLADYVANEGIRASRLLAAITEGKLPNKNHKYLRERLLRLWSSHAAKSLTMRFRGLSSS